VDLEELLESLHLSRGRYRTLEARIRRRVDGAVLADDRQRRGMEPPVTIGWSEAVDHLWFQSPTRWLVEAESGPGAGLIVGQDGERAVRNFRIEDVTSGEIERAVYVGGPPIYREVMWEPNLLIPEMWLEPIGTEQVAGRAAVSVRGLQRPTSNDFLTVTPAESYELEVDVERGVLLRYSMLYGGRVGLSEEVLHIAFDKPLPETLFDDR
jgi:hypothetical protein